MMSLAVIHHLAQQEGRRAARNKRKPLIVEREDLDNLAEHIRHVPNFGDYRPKGWTLTETFFVDKSGWGSEGEPALTFPAFVRKVAARARAIGGGLAYAIIEEGEFQVYIGEFTQGVKK